MSSHTNMSNPYAPHVYELFSDYKRSALIVSQLPAVKKCKALRELVTPEWLESQYLPEQPNIGLVRGVELPGELRGLVTRRDVDWHGARRGLFLIQVGQFSNAFAEHFVIAHELGHVLLHGRLMHAGMVVVERLWEATAEEDDLRGLLELEANIYALLSIVPGPVLDALELVIGAAPSAAALQHAMQWLSGTAFDLQLARERLLLHRTLHTTIRVEEFQRVIGEVERSWTLHGWGHSAPEHEREPTEHGLSEQHLAAWLLHLRDGKLLNDRFWPLARTRKASVVSSASDQHAWLVADFA